MGKNLIKEFMTEDILSVQPDQTILEAARFMMGKGVRSLLVKDGENHVGIVTKTDFILRVYVNENMDPEKDRVSDIMTQGVKSMEGSKTMEEARRFMQQNKIGHLLVTEEGKVVGILSKKNLTSYFGNLGMP